MDLDDLRNALDAAGSAARVDVNAARETVGARARHLRRRQRGLTSAVALLVVVALAAGAIAVFGSGSRNRVDIAPPGDGPVPTTSAPVATTTTTVATASDPLPAGSVMLAVSGRTISALDAQGRVVASHVIALEGQTIVNAQLMPDHRTIYYAIEFDDHRACPSVLKLDLVTSIKTMVANADDFAITPDGSKQFLLRPKTARWVQDDCRPLPYPAGVKLVEADFVVRDLANHTQSVLAENEYPSAGSGGPTGHVWMSPTGEELIASTCVIDGCGAIAYTVPRDLKGAIVPAPASAAIMCGCRTLVSGPDGVYAVDEGNDVGGVRKTRLLRYDPANVTGSGTVVVAPTDVTLTSWVAPTSDGLFVIGVANPHTTSLYRIVDGALEIVRNYGKPPGGPGSIYPIPRYVP